MIYDATSHALADPFLVEALKRSLALTHDTGKQLELIMQQVREKHGELPVGTSFKYGPEQIELLYSPPEEAAHQREIIHGVQDRLLDIVSRASTLEQQENLLYQSMHEMLELSIIGHVPPRVAHAYAATMLGLFDEYAKAGMPLSEALDDMRENMEFYVNIHNDTLAAAEALTINHQLRQGVPPEEVVAMPYDLAWERAGKRMPGHEFTNGDERLMFEAREIVTEITEQYDAALPRDCSVEMLGLILRCAERVHTTKAPTGIHPSKFLPQEAANDNSAAGGAEMEPFNHPLVTKRVNHLLGQIFLKHMDAAHSPQALMEAAADLETVLELEEKRAREKGR